jgi:hypothetical protein
MKTLFIVVVLVAIVGALYMYRDRFFLQSSDGQCPTADEVWDSKLERCLPRVQDTGMADQGQPFEFDIGKINRIVLILDDAGTKKTVAVTRDENKAKLTAQFEIDGSSAEGNIMLLDEHTVYQEYTDDVLIPYVVNYSGSGSFVSIGLFTQKDDATLEMQDAYLLGDRILVDRLILEGSNTPYILHAYFRDRKAGEAFAEVPTVRKEVIVTIEDHMFGEDAQIRENASHTTYKDLITIESPTSGETIFSPLIVRGEARGQWFFEASFPITVVDWDGRIIGEGHAEAQGEWMTSEYVPFEGTISFTVPPDTPYKRGTIIFRKDNPSGLPEHDDAFEVPVLFR